MRQYVIRISLVDPDSEDLEFTIIRDDGSDTKKVFTDTLLHGVHRVQEWIAKDYEFGAPA